MGYARIKFTGGTLELLKRDCINVIKVHAEKGLYKEVYNDSDN